jgi:hypothetical protein
MSASAAAKKATASAMARTSMPRGSDRARQARVQEHADTIKIV